MELPIQSVLDINELGVRLALANGAQRFVSFAECQAHCALRLPRIDKDSAPLVGFRDRSAARPWIELAAPPPVRIVFEPGPVRSTVLGGRFVVRAAPAGYQALLDAVAAFGYRFGDLA